MTLDELIKFLVIVIPVGSALLGALAAWVGGRPFRNKVGETNKIVFDAMADMRHEFERVKAERDDQRAENTRLVVRQQLLLKDLISEWEKRLGCVELSWAERWKQSEQSIVDLKQENVVYKIRLATVDREHEALKAMYGQVLDRQRDSEQVAEQQRSELNNAITFLQAIGLTKEQTELVLKGELKPPQVTDAILMQLHYKRGDTATLKERPPTL